MTMLTIRNGKSILIIAEFLLGRWLKGSGGTDGHEDNNEEMITNYKTTTTTNH